MSKHNRRFKLDALQCLTLVSALQTAIDYHRAKYNAADVSDDDWVYHNQERVEIEAVKEEIERQL